MTSETTHDWPDTLAGACGRIDAYRDTLQQARFALITAGLNIGSGRAATHDQIKKAIERIDAELAVTNP